MSAPTMNEHALAAQVRDALHAAYQMGVEGNRPAFRHLDGVLHRTLLGALCALPAPEPAPPDGTGNVVTLTQLIAAAERAWSPYAKHGLTRAEFVAIELLRQGVARSSLPVRAAPEEKT